MKELHITDLKKYNGFPLFLRAVIIIPSDPEDAEGFKKMSELTSFEIMTDKRLNEVENTLVDIKGKLEKIFNAVVGNSELDQLGLIGRIKKLEEEFVLICL